MPRLLRTALALTLLVAVPACAGSAGSGAPQPDSRSLSPMEIEDALRQNVGTLYDLVSTRKPTWLRSRAGSPGGPGMTVSTHEVAVWLDGVRLGGVAQLRTIPLNTVAAARYLTPSEAQAQLGLNNLGGAIQVTSRR